MTLVARYNRKSEKISAAGENGHLGAALSRSGPKATKRLRTLRKRERVLALDPSAPVRRNPPVLKTDVAPYCVKSRVPVMLLIIQACYRALVN